MATGNTNVNISNNAVSDFNFQAYLLRLIDVEYRNDLDPILNDIHEDALHGRITGPQEQKLEVLIDRLRQKPSRPSTNTVQQANNLELPSGHPVLRHSSASNYVSFHRNVPTQQLNSEQQNSSSGGRSRRLRRQSRRGVLRRHRNRSVISQRRH
jgi:hypothetical protein